MSARVLTKEQAVLLNLATRSVWRGEDAPVLDAKQIEGVNWREVMKESLAQAVPLATFEALAPYKAVVPTDVFDEWKKIATKVALANIVVAKARRALHKVMDGEPYVILKGVSAASYYPNPNVRVAGDVDFLIDPAHRDEVSARLVANGYAMSYGDHANHWVYTKGSAHLEMHFEVAGVPFKETGKLVNAYLADCVYNAVKGKTDDGEFPAPTAEKHALIILLHMQHHLLGDGLGLRHICDWVAFVNATRSQEFWQELIAFLKKIGLYRFTLVLTQLAVKYLGLTAPDWCTDGDGTEDEVMQDVFISGNFGVKDEARSQAGILVSENGKDGTKHGAVYNLMHNLHGAVLRQYPIVKKVWVLYPFLYAYKALRFVALSLFGKRPNLIKIAPEAKKRKAIYKKLRVFERETEEK